MCRWECPPSTKLTPFHHDYVSTSKPMTPDTRCSCGSPTKLSPFHHDRVTTCWYVKAFLFSILRGTRLASSLLKFKSKVSAAVFSLLSSYAQVVIRIVLLAYSSRVSIKKGGIEKRCSAWSQPYSEYLVGYSRVELKTPDQCDMM
jgi:hypothetical protein